jgi:hypothetical protein
MSEEQKLHREFWLHEYCDSQPLGFLSGEISVEKCYDVFEQKTEDCMHLVEYSALEAANEELAELGKDKASNDKDYLELSAKFNGLTSKLERAKEALRFYAPSNAYEYDKIQGVNYIWNDQGSIAREVLAEIEEI